MAFSVLLHWAVDGCYVSFFKDPLFPLLHYLILSPPLWTDKGPWIHDERRCNWAQWSYRRKIGVQTLALSPLHYQPLEFCSWDNLCCCNVAGRCCKDYRALFLLASFIWAGQREALLDMHSIVRAKGPDSNFPQVPIKPTAKQMGWSEVCAVHRWEVVISLISFGVSLTGLSKTEKQNLFFFLWRWLLSGVGFKGGRTLRKHQTLDPIQGLASHPLLRQALAKGLQGRVTLIPPESIMEELSQRWHPTLGWRSSLAVRWVCRSSPRPLPLDVSGIPSLKSWQKCLQTLPNTPQMAKESFA